MSEPKIDSSAESATRARTRQAILDTAVTCLSAEPDAPLSAIAQAAGIGRSTLHRYFPERDDLMRALVRHVHALSNRAIELAEPESGPPVAALRRVVERQFDLGPILAVIYASPLILSDADLLAEVESGDEAVVSALQRASARRPPGPPGWERRAFWSLLSAGWESFRLDGRPRHEVVDAIMSTLVGGLISPDEDDGSAA
ncbi:TetR/AcrR family transcriptional regulator [Leucobacter sp. M11]|uniref:TetR/AcrR family transcriptional regulator n=1 Tax=Leucobacter sp. M11 TaxID=2993565 RepID=UPI002D7F14B6|nr:TetR/AcrR family transcriptional regulator [Leucobacter sp. M11]MEB4616282.1 TetR/AcrR family transcriptional regulator [Leucobacter sp. M11]